MIVLADPDSLETVGDGAFKGCDLEEAVIMKDVQYGSYVFGFNEKLGKAVVEDGVELIPAYCFEGCTALKQIAIPDSVKTVGWASFKNAGDDLTVYLPRGLELIEDEAFGKQGDGEQRFRIVLTGDPEIETYHVCGYYTKKSTYALDGFAVYRLYTEGGPNLSAYKNGANWFPGDVRPLPSVITFEAPDQEVTAGEAPDPSLVKITVDGTELGEGDCTIDFDTSDLTPGERTVDVLLGDYEAEEYLVASELSAAFGGREVSGTVYGFIPAEDLVMTVNVLKKDEPQPGEPLLAVGDGNHSLATAKAAWEELKASGESERHPFARYALCEIVNIYDASLEFEPIYRLVKTDRPEELLDAFRKFASVPGELPGQSFTAVSGKGERVISSRSARFSLPVTTLQTFLDGEGKRFVSDTDYIHGEDELRSLASREGYLGFLFRGMEKGDQFSSVGRDGCLPRKTFSMGHADDKRYYMECRRI